MTKSLTQKVEELERKLIRAALHRTAGIQVRAAKLLGISERVLRYKMKKYRLVSTTKMSGKDRNVELHFTVQS